jgi:hypothetical protein
LSHKKGQNNYLLEDVRDECLGSHISNLVYDPFRRRDDAYTSLRMIELDASCQSSLSEEPKLGDDQLVDLDMTVNWVRLRYWNN